MDLRVSDHFSFFFFFFAISFVTTSLLETPKTSAMLFPHPFLPALREGVWNGGLGKGEGLKSCVGVL